MTNTYHKITAAPEVAKAITGANVANVPAATYHFSIEAVSAKELDDTTAITGDIPVPANLTADIALAKNETSGSSAFGAITYKRTGIYRYKIKEGVSTPEIAGMNYSEQEVIAKVTVTENATSHALEAVIAYSGGDRTDGNTITNTEKVSNVKVTKAFTGLADLPANFKITNNFDTTLEFTVANALGSGTETDPYYWIIENVPVGTEVVFTETGILVDGYDLEVNGTATTVDTATVAATSTENIVATAELVNDYNQRQEEIPVPDSVNIFKQDQNKDPLDGAEFTLYTAATCEDTDKVKTFSGKEFEISTEDPDLAPLLPVDPAVPVSLYLKETKTPEGYVPDATVHEIIIKVDISEPTYNDEKDLFVITTTYTMTIDNEESIEIINKQTSVKVQKVDIVTGEELTGATIQILDKDENVLYEWISEKDKPYEVLGLKIGEEYILRETVAPEKYDVTADTHFTIDETGTVTSGDTKIREDGVLLVQDALKSGVTVAVKKVWVDDNNRDGKRPEKLVIDLLADGEKVDSVTLDEGNHWISQIRDLPKYNAKGEEIKYSWTEPTVEGYTQTGSVKNGTITTLTNIYGPATTQVKVEKTWADNGQHPDEIEVQLYANGKAVGGAVKLSEANGWKYSWNDLCKYEAGSEIIYTVAETAVPEGYESKITGNPADGFVITNTKLTGKLRIEKGFNILKAEEQPEEEEAKSEIEVVKVWDDADNKYGNRPEKITVRLYAGGKEIAQAELSAGNGWRKMFSDLPKSVNGRAIKYSVSEDPVKGYVTTINGFTITNRYVPQSVEVSVQKIWNDRGSEQFRPKSVTVMLSNGMAVELNAKNNWHAVISGLPKYVNGEEAVYTWTEKPVIGYTLEKQETNGNQTVITNKRYTRDKTPARGGKGKTSGDDLFPLEDYETPLGVEVIINHVGDCFD